jgi:hypothetical protein
MKYCDSCYVKQSVLELTLPKQWKKDVEIWYMACEELVYVRVTYDSSQGISEVQIRINGCKGG